MIVRVAAKLAGPRALQAKGSAPHQALRCSHRSSVAQWQANGWSHRSGTLDQLKHTPRRRPQLWGHRHSHRASLQASCRGPLRFCSPTEIGLSPCHKM